MLIGPFDQKEKNVSRRQLDWSCDGLYEHLDF